MYNPDTELLFPARILPALRDLRDTPWQELVGSVIAAGPDSLEQFAFTLMMARLNNCATCNSDSYRAINGCTMCAKQTLKRFRESDQTLLKLFKASRLEVEHYLQQRTTEIQEVP